MVIPKKASGMYMAQTVAPTTQWTTNRAAPPQDRPQENPLFPASSQARQAQHGKGHQVIPQNGLPADGKAPVKHHLKQAVGKARHQPPTGPPAHGKEKNGQHPQSDGPAPGHLPQLEHTENLGQSHQNGPFTKHLQFSITHSFIPPVGW